jgi:hypothetical protein
MAPTKIETKTVMVEVEKKHEDTKTNEVKVEIIKPDGTRTITTNTKTETKTDIEKNSRVDSNTIVEHKSQGTNINILAGVDILNPKLVYGGHITRDIFGPFSIGIFGFTNGLAGASVGFRF